MDTQYHIGDTVRETNFGFTGEVVAVWNQSQVIWYTVEFAAHKATGFDLVRAKLLACQLELVYLAQDEEAQQAYINQCERNC